MSEQIHNLAVYIKHELRPKHSRHEHRRNLRPDSENEEISSLLMFRMQMKDDDHPPSPKRLPLSLGVDDSVSAQSSSEPLRLKKP